MIYLFEVNYNIQSNIITIMQEPTHETLNALQLQCEMNDPHSIYLYRPTHTNPYITMGNAHHYICASLSGTQNNPVWSTWTYHPAPPWRARHIHVVLENYVILTAYVHPYPKIISKPKSTNFFQQMMMILMMTKTVVHSNYTQGVCKRVMNNKIRTRLTCNIFDLGTTGHFLLLSVQTINN